jgi:hypothetical protein
MNERVFDGFCADPGAFCAAMPRISQKKSNAERREMGNNTPFSLNIHTPWAASRAFHF